MATLLHVIDTTGPGGAETVFIELADRLRARGHNSIVTIRGEGWVADTLRKKGLDPIVIDCKGSFNLKFLYQLHRLVKQHNVDLVQSHLLGSNVYCGLLGLLTRVPVVGTFHGVVDVAPDERFTGLKLGVMNHGLSRFVSVCQGLADAIAERGLLNLEKTEVIYNGVDIPRYAKAEDQNLRAQLGLPEDALLAGCLGNIRPAKAYDVLIKALPAVLQRFPNFHVAVAGHAKGPLQQELEDLAVSLGVREHIHFLGFCNDSAAHLASIDAFLLPSRSEGFPVSLIEALSANLPIIATRCVGTEEILQHGVNGWLIEPENIEALSDALIKLLSNDPIMPDWSRQVESAQRFSMDSMLNDYEALYQSVSKN